MAERSNRQLMKDIRKGNTAKDRMRLALDEEVAPSLAMQAATAKPMVPKNIADNTHRESETPECFEVCKLEYYSNLCRVSHNNRCNGEG